MKLFEQGDKIEVLNDDERKGLKGKQGVVREQFTDLSPFWCNVTIDGTVIPVRGTSLKKLPKELDSE